MLKLECAREGLRHIGEKKQAQRPLTLAPLGQSLQHRHIRFNGPQLVANWGQELMHPGQRQAQP